MNDQVFVTNQQLTRALDGMYVKIEDMVGRVVGKIVGDALQLISERFDRLEARMDRMEVRMDHIEVRMDGMEVRMDGMEAKMDGIENRMERVEDKLDQTVSLVHLHAVDIRQLQRKTA